MEHHCQCQIISVVPVQSTVECTHPHLKNTSRTTTFHIDHITRINPIMNMPTIISQFPGLTWFHHLIPCAMHLTLYLTMTLLILHRHHYCIRLHLMKTSSIRNTLQSSFVPIIIIPRNKSYQRSGIVMLSMTFSQKKVSILGYNQMNHRTISMPIRNKA